MTPIWRTCCDIKRRDGVDDQETAQNQGQEAERRQQQGQRIEQVLQRQLAWLRYLDAR